MAQDSDEIAAVDIPVLTRQDWAMTEGVTCVSCPDCAFTFDAAHTEVDQAEGGPYDCPACWAHRALYLKCHICGHRKWASTPERATYLLAFHMDRRHKGWTTDA